MSHNDYFNAHAPTIPCTCLAILKPDILCVLGAPIDNQPPPLTPAPPNVIQFTEYTYCHDKFPNTATTGKKMLNTTHSYKQLEVRTTGWQVDPLITITVGIRWAIHEQPIKGLEKSQNTKK